MSLAKWRKLTPTWLVKAQVIGDIGLSVIEQVRSAMLQCYVVVQ